MTFVKDVAGSTLLPGLLSTFVAHFRRAIRQEMEARESARGEVKAFLRAVMQVSTGECWL